MLARTCLACALLCAVLLFDASRTLARVQDVPPVAPTSDTQPTFDSFLDGVRQEALAKGISAATLDRVLTGLTPEPVVIARDRAQPELTQSLDSYVSKRITPAVVRTGVEMAGTHAAVLEQVDKTYGVPPALMVAIWGIESNYGRFTGTYPTIRSLATLAFDARRALFRTELLDAITIVDQGKVDPDAMKGSWAGAMGQPQFMPSKFLSDAVDFDGDGRVDIWTNTADVFGSMANFLHQSGWTAGERWGREVRLSRAAATNVDRAVTMRASGCGAIRQLTTAQPLSDWKTLGLTLVNGAELPSSTISASLVRGEKRAFLVYVNYEALLTYNCSNSYAIAVGLLADRIAAAK